MSDINETLDMLTATRDCFTVAASCVMTDYGDVLVRGYLKQHPAVVAYRLDVLADVMQVVRNQVARELAQDDLPSCDPADAANDHHEEVAEYAAHTCNCEWCSHAVSEFPQIFASAGITLPSESDLTAPAKPDDAALKLVQDRLGAEVIRPTQPKE